MSHQDWLLVRTRLFGTAAAAGVVAGGLAVLGLTVVRPLDFASTQTFAVGALVLGFGVLGWSGSVLAGRGVESLQAYLDADTDWTEADSRRAMTRVSGFGVGVMVGVVVTTVAIG
ncbi:DUF7268 family protein [Halococcus hamelinensis]|uniref:Uncharacterized protein n=1 Tax=Halococcus hamelinensis 100A6 TaxID=1132509 RepID=M0M3A0_9EURY|nr:hypothetical protein [Halococcus hamelinensis]EMA40171.1 hypothetical protein C447_04547 [Halococcus hamelinensis 100A6]